ncbi:ankyrin repeat domain-containing protein [Cryomyces antarcticus]
MAQQQPLPTIDRLLNLVPDSPSTVLSHLQSQPDLASACDSHGYSLLHAASSYAQLDLLRALVNTYNASPNITDEDNETPLFAAESVEVAQCLVSELGADPSRRNDEGQTAEEKMESEGDFPLVAAWLRENAAGTSDAAGTSQETNGVHPPPPLPDNVKINIGTIEEPSQGDGQDPDPEFRRRIEELAAREDFQGEEGQRELRNLITEAVTGLAADGQGRDVRRRLG